MKRFTGIIFGSPDPDSNIPKLYQPVSDRDAFQVNYVPDELDEVSADVNCYVGIYSVTYHETPEEITNENFPATFIAYGSADAGLWDWGFESFKAVKDMGIPCELHTFSGVPHGFGAGTHADGTFYENAAGWPALADVFMQNVYSGVETRRTDGEE